MSRFYLQTQSGKQGPFTTEQLQRFVDAGKIARTLDVYTEAGVAIGLDDVLETQPNAPAWAPAPPRPAPPSQRAARRVPPRPPAVDSAPHEDSYENDEPVPSAPVRRSRQERGTPRRGGARGRAAVAPGRGSGGGRGRPAPFRAKKSKAPLIVAIIGILGFAGFGGWWWWDQSRISNDPTQLFKAVRSFATDAEVVPLWDSIPSKHRDEIQATVRAFATKVPEEDYNLLMECVELTGQVLASKRELILAAIEGLPASRTAFGADDLRNVMLAASQLIKAIPQGQVKTLSGLKSIDIRAHLVAHGHDLAQSSLLFARLLGKFRSDAQIVEILNGVGDLTFSTIQRGERTATVEIRSSAGVETEEMVLIDDRWWPKEASRGFAKLAEYRAGIEESESLPKITERVRAAKATLESLLASDDPKQFEAAADLATTFMISFLASAR